MKINTYIFFNGQCAEAFRFYEHLLGGRIEMMQTNGESPVADQTPPEQQDAILHARLVIGDQALMGSDAPPQYFEKPQGFYVSIQMEEPAEAEQVFHALSEGGTVRMPIQQTFWATRSGMLVDRFGTPWMVNCDSPAG